MAFKPTIKNVLITGSPGVGKTTAVLHIIDAVRDKNNRYASVVDVKGFYSLERRKNSYSNHSNYRIGFDIISVVDGTSSILARTEQEFPQNIYNQYNNKFNKYKNGSSSSLRYVGKYIVDVIGFEKYALPLLQKSKSQNDKQTIFIIDEIGKMELFSVEFEKCVERIVNDPSFIVIATVPSKHNIGFVEKLKRRKDTKLYTLTPNNRNIHTTYITKCVFQLIDARTSMIKNNFDNDQYYNESKQNWNNNDTSNDNNTDKKEKYYNYNQNKSYRKKV